ncbi:hypothetical protein [Streptomyces reniochalinae]|uniref:Uncharacterized protein n=1 Tax=Streptomyces reniochalinae TaxID=2250578 RepID=A0A367EKE6_9ACTN|nr:hypothetical protein [Streptomyces reniochalinae]RCG17660.1 hypothetical protein DQ392_17630 [Streptomyces reniochalinae]
MQRLLDGRTEHHGSRKEKPFRDLVKELGDGPGEGSWARYCGEGRSSGDSTGPGCIGEDTKHDRDSMHNKFSLFTRTLGKSWVVSNSTSNVTPAMQEMWNSQYTVVGDHPLYDRYLGYFTKSISLAC